MGRIVVATNGLQKNYQYRLTAPIGRNFDDSFRPELTPKEMLTLGVFGGVYLRDSTDEFPKNWFTHAKFARDAKKEKNLNYFKVQASQSLALWRKNGWIHPDDPRGWFQWYCRYYMGRRHEDDARQIRRWRAMRRHVAQIKHHCGVRDFACRPRQRQVLLHWAYDSRRL